MRSTKVLLSLLVVLLVSPSRFATALNTDALVTDRASLAVPLSSWRTCNSDVAIHGTTYIYTTTTSTPTTTGNVVKVVSSTGTGALQIDASYSMFGFTGIPQLGAVAFSNGHTYVFGLTGYSVLDENAASRFNFNAGTALTAYSTPALANGAVATTVIGTDCSGAGGGGLGYILTDQCTLYTFADSMPTNAVGTWTLVAGDTVNFCSPAVPFANAVAGVPETLGANAPIGQLTDTYLSEDGTTLYFRRTTAGEENTVFFLTLATMQLDHVVFTLPASVPANAVGIKHSAYSPSLQTITFLLSDGTAYAGSLLTGKVTAIAFDQTNSGAPKWVGTLTGETAADHAVFLYGGVADNVLVTQWADLAFAAQHDECLLESGTSNNCDANSVCTDQQVGFQCDCDTGYEGTGFVCANIDECTAGTSACHADSQCTDTVGWYTCACNAGFEDTSAEPAATGTTCADFNECGGFGDGNTCDATHGQCTNTPGSFTCACPIGFDDVNADGTSCVDFDECIGENNGIACDANTACTNTPGSYTCACLSGFNDTSVPPARDGTTCADYNECTGANGGNVCDTAHGECVNSAGSHACVCNAGYEDTSALADGSLCTDINECASAGLNTCAVQGGVCTNIAGGYTCACQSGTTDANGNDPVGTNCIDILECDAIAPAHNCSALGSACTELFGSFDCACVAGFTDSSEILLPGDIGTDCVDVNECTAETSSCDANAACTNTVGAHTCACNSGYADIVNFDPAEVGFVCEDVNECLLEDTCVAEAVGGSCANSPAASFTCGCIVGYIGDGVPVSNGGTGCTAINECDVNHGGCHAEATCTDLDSATPGPTHSCVCADNYFGDGVTCAALDLCATDALSPAQFPFTAGCTAGDPTACAVFTSGTAGVSTTCAASETECDYHFTATNACDIDANSACASVDTVVTCSCATGYTFDVATSLCVDNDECALDTHTCDSNAACVNTVGSFECTCNPGYEMIDNVCSYIDVCDPNPCGLTHTNCAEIPGVPMQVAECTCVVGFEGDPYTNCTDITECVNAPTACNLFGTCVNTLGSAHCECDPGFTAVEFQCVLADPTVTLDLAAMISRGAFTVPITSPIAVLTLSALTGTLDNTLTLEIAAPDTEITLDCGGADLTSTAAAFLEITNGPLASLTLRNCPALTTQALLLGAIGPLVLEDSTLNVSPMDLSEVTGLAVHNTHIEADSWVFPVPPPP